MKSLSAILILLFFVSCGSEKSDDASKKDKESKENHEDHDHGSSDESLHLNDGKRWKVNPETTEGVEKMTTRIGSFDLNAPTEEYQILFDSLDSDFRYIFKMCSAEGEAHDQLHVLLFPLRGMFNKLKSPEEDVRKKAFENIKNQLVKYPDYFESN